MYKYIYYNLYSNDFLSHHGVQGMHWGVRRYQPYPNGIPKGSKEVGAATKVKQRNEGETPGKGSIFTYSQRKKNLIKQLKKENKDQGTRKEVKRFAEDEAERQLKDQYGLKKAEKAEKVEKVSTTIKKVKNTVAVGKVALSVGLVGAGAIAAKKLGAMENKQIREMVKQKLIRTGSTSLKTLGVAAVTDAAVSAGTNLAIKAEDKIYEKKHSQNS